MEKRKDTQTTMINASGEKTWYLIDAAGKTLGRLSAEISKILRGKHKVTYTPHAPMGDGVVVINAEKIHVTGAKRHQKVYRYYTGFISGMREVPFANMLDRKPEYIIEHAVRGMMPKTRLGRKQMKSLRVLKGSSYEQFVAQKPVIVDC